MEDSEFFARKLSFLLKLILSCIHEKPGIGETVLAAIAASVSSANNS